MPSKPDYLDRLWNEVINIDPEGAWLLRGITASRSHAEHYPGYAAAMERLKETGLTLDLGRISRLVRYETCFAIACSLDDPGIPRGRHTGLVNLVEQMLSPTGKIRKADASYLESLRTTLGRDDDGKWLRELAKKQTGDAPFDDVGPAAKRLIATGVALKDLGRLAAWSRYEASRQALQLLEESGLPDEEEIPGLHELLLGSDPSGLEGRSGSWPLEQPAADRTKPDGGLVEPIWKTRFGHALAFSPDSKVLAIAGASGPARLFDTATGKELRACEGLKIHISHLTFSPDGRRLVVGQMYDRVAICDVASGKLLAKGVFGNTKVNHLEQVSGLLWSAKTGEILRSAWKRVIDLIDPTSAKALEPFQPASSTRSIYAIAFSPDGNRVCAVWSPGGFGKHRVNVWSWPERDTITSFDTSPEFIHDVAFSPDGGTIAIPVRDILKPEESGVLLYNASTGKSTGKLSIKGSGPMCIAFTPSGSHLAVPNENRISIWDWRNAKEVGCWDISKSSTDVYQLAFSPCGEFLAAASERGAMVWRQPLPGL